MSARLKRNAVVVTMAVLVCAAAALNWKYAGQEVQEGVQDAGTKILGEATLVSGTEDGEDTPAAAPEDESGVYTGSDYRPGTAPSLFCRRRRPRRTPTPPWPTKPRRASRSWPPSR